MIWKLYAVGGSFMKSKYSAMLLAFSLGITASAFASTPYDDVPLDHWAYDAIETLTAHGVIDGYPDGTFRGNQPITRFEMAKMIRNAVLSQDEIHDKDRKLSAISGGKEISGTAILMTIPAPAVAG